MTRHYDGNLSSKGQFLCQTERGDPLFDSVIVSALSKIFSVHETELKSLEFTVSCSSPCLNRSAVGKSDIP